MVRWKPGAKDRLRAAALDLYVSRGFEQTTVTEIAASVGLTERTFFRHFADKREVLFDGQDVVEQSFLDGVTAAPADATPMEVVAVALARSTDYFPDERREYARRRASVIAAHPALQERELLKMARLATSLAAALRGRGVPEPTATIAAQSAITVFGVAFAQWIDVAESRTLGEIEQAGLSVLREMAR